MKHTLFILALITATIQTFAQSPRIKLNQITKDSLPGSVLVSSPTDSGMVYSRDLFISYGADTVLILGGDTLAATSSIISSVLSDGVTITGDGTTGSELTVDTATVIATKGDLSDYVTIAGTQTITGAKTFTSALTQSGGDVNFDSGTLFVDEDEDRVGIGTSSPNVQLHLQDGASEDVSGSTIRMDLSGINAYWEIQARNGVNAANRKLHFYTDSPGSNEVLTLTQAGNVGIGTTTVTEELDVDGNARFRSIGSGASAGALHYTSTGVLTTNTSDVRLKTNLQPLENTLNKLLDINTYTFNWINETDRVDLGMVAQEVEEIFPRLVFTNSVDGYKGIHYDKFSSILAKAIQEQQAIIEQQANEIETLKSQIQLILNEIEQLKNN